MRPQSTVGWGDSTGISGWKVSHTLSLQQIASTARNGPSCKELGSFGLSVSKNMGKWSCELSLVTSHSWVELCPRWLLREGRRGGVLHHAVTAFLWLTTCMRASVHLQYTIQLLNRHGSDSYIHSSFAMKLTGWSRGMYCFPS